MLAILMNLGFAGSGITVSISEGHKLLLSKENNVLLISRQNNVLLISKENNILRLSK